MNELLYTGRLWRKATKSGLDCQVPKRLMHEVNTKRAAAWRRFILDSYFSWEPSSSENFANKEFCFFFFFLDIMFWSSKIQYLEKWKKFLWKNKNEDGNVVSTLVFLVFKVGYFQPIDQFRFFLQIFFALFYRISSYKFKYVNIIIVVYCSPILRISVSISRLGRFLYLCDGLKLKIFILHVKH